MTAVKVNCYLCPECFQPYTSTEEALECCNPKPIPPKVERWICDSCGKFHSSKGFANNCRCQKETT